VSARRERILAKLDLGPRWRLRERRRSAEERRGAMAVEAAAEPGAAATPFGEFHHSVSPREAASASLDLDDRPARIARMDWPALKTAVASCEACALCRTRTHTVFGVGDEHAEWLIVGEAPGAEEDARGEPFVGQAGRLLDSMLAAIGLRRGENVYIANILKCRPPGNRDPEPYEVAQCTPHLARQIELIRPRLIVALGRSAAQTLLNTEASIASLRGKVFRYQGVPTIVTYHSAYLLRNLPDKAKAWEDLCFARATMRELKAAGAAPS
jgi:DNA polymerase